jgi:hypothetical protein
MLAKHGKRLVNGLILGVVVTSITVSLIQQPIEADTGWFRVGNGNMDIMTDENSTLFYPSPTTYIEGLQGARGKDFKLGTKAAYKLSSPTDSSVQPKQINVIDDSVTLNDEIIPIIKVDGMAFLANREETRRISTGQIVTDVKDRSNLWLISNDGATAFPLLNNTGYDDLLRKVIEDNGTKEEDKIYLVRANNPKPVSNGTQIAFQSNMHVASSGKGDSSVYVVNIDGSNERILMDSEKYGSVRIVDTAKDIVVAHNTNKNTLIIGDTQTGVVTEYPFNGWADVLSQDGRFLFFRKIDGDNVTQNFYVINLSTGEESKVSGLPNGYFYNTGGEWSPDGTRFTFIANGFDQINEKKLYRDNNLLVVLDTETMSIQSYGKPEGSAAIYPLGSIHWTDSNHIMVYFDDDSSWIKNVSK